MFKRTDKGIIIGKSHSSIVKLDKYITGEENEDIRILALGSVGKGRALHPWDNLKKCECSGTPWMEGKNSGNFEEGEPYKIKCLKCGKHTKSGNIDDIRNDWNNILAEKELEIVIIDPINEYEELAKMLGGKVMHITPNNVGKGAFNQLTFKEESITKEKVIELMKLNIELRKELKMDTEPANILKEMCSVNGIELSESYTEEVLKAVIN